MIPHREFVELLSQLNLSDNAARRSAEEIFDALRGQNNCEVCNMLVSVVSDKSTTVSIQRFAAVMLRRLLVQQGRSTKSYNPEQLASLRSSVLRALDGETEVFLKSRICDIVSYLCDDDMDENDWPELLPYTYSCLNSPNPLSLEIGLALLGMICPLFIDKFLVPSNCQTLVHVLDNCFKSTMNITIDPQNASVLNDNTALNALGVHIVTHFRILIATMRTLSELLSNLPQESDSEAFFCLIPGVMTGLQNILTHTELGNIEQATASAYIEGMLEIAENCGLFFATHHNLNHIFEIILSWITGYGNSLNAPSGSVNTSGTVLNGTIVHLLIEFLVTIASTSPKLVRKLKSTQPVHRNTKNYFAARLFPVCIQLMCNVKDDPNWETKTTGEDNDDDDVDEEEKSTNATDEDVGESALDRMCQSLGLKSTYALVSTQLLTLFTSGNWKQQHCGLRFLGNYVEVSKNFTEKKQLSQHRKEVLSIVIQFSSNSNYRVRGAAYYALNQFLIMHGNSILSGSLNNHPSSVDQQNQLISIVLPNVLDALSIKVNPPPRVRRFVMASLINLIDSCIPTSMLEERGPDGVSHGLTSKILTAVVEALNEGPVLIQEYCVSVIISLAETVRGKQFVQYYDALMPILKQLLVYTQQAGLESFWGTVIECIAIVGESCGKDRFYNDANEMMNHLVSLSKQVDEDAEIRRYILKAWVRIARCLGAEFLPFLQIVMEKLFLAISQDVNVKIPEGDDEEDAYAEMEQRSDIHMLETPDGGWIAVRSAAVEEQSSACQLLVLLVEKMQEHFYPLVEQTVVLMNPLLNSPHEDVRSYCMVTLPELVRSTAKATAPDRTALIKLSDYVLGLLVKAIETEGTLELIMTGLQAMKQVLFYLCSDWAALLLKCEKDAEVKLMGDVGSMSGSSMKQLKDEKVAELKLLDPPAPTPTTSIKSLNDAQMGAITEACKVILRDSLQRRAMLRAQTQLAAGHERGQEHADAFDGVGDEEDVADEALFMSDSMELHFNVAEVIGAILRTHGESFLSCYMSNWHEMIVSMTQEYCLREDKQFAYFIISDVIEFGLPAALDAHGMQIADGTTAYLRETIPLLISVCRTCSDDPSLRQTCAYALGIAAQRFPLSFASFAPVALQALALSIQVGEDPEDGEMRGNCTDNCVASVGTILENMELLQSALLSHNNQYQMQHLETQAHEALAILGQIPYYDVWGQWLDYLPLYHDRDEGLKVYTQLCRLVRNRHASLLGADAINTNGSNLMNNGDIYSKRSVIALSTLLQVLEDNSCLPSAAGSNKLINMSTNVITSSELRYDILESIHFLKIGRNPIDMDQFKKSLEQMNTVSTNTISAFNAREKLLNKLNEILSTSLPSQRIFDATTSNKRPPSPSTTAPIHDVLMMRS